MIRAIPINDIDFAQALSLVVRTYLEMSHRIARSTTKTGAEILAADHRENVRKFIEICGGEAYAHDTLTPTEREHVRSLAETIILDGIHR